MRGHKSFPAEILRVRRPLRWLLILPLAAIPSCDAISEHPLAAADDVKVDQRLLGA